MNKKALSLAVCIAMALPTASNALSLGDIESNSSLNQPFEGTINLLSTSIKEANLLKVKVASPAVFNRVGIDRPAFLNSIRFRTTVRNGKPVIIVRSSQPINEPFLNFLLEVSWPNGQLLKEYTVLLDPPVLVQADTAIASNAAGVRKEPGRQNQTYTPPATTQTARQQPRRVVRSVAPARQTQLRRPAQPRRTASSSSRVRNYRVRRGDTLYKVASKLGYKGIRKEQMMLALFNKNERAFNKRNMNNLKAGALLSRPSYQEAKAFSSRKAKAEVVAQARAWKQGRAGSSIAKKTTKPKTVVASNTPNKTNNQARVEVMGGNNSLNANLAAGGAGSATLKDLTKQLALTNEALTTRLKENNDLKSRVSELESLLRQKNKLITLKSEQLARLQEKMRGAGIPAPAQTNTEVPTIESIADNEGTDIQQQVAIEQSNERGEIIRNNSDQLAMVTDSAPITNTADTEDTASSPFKDDSTSSESDSLDIMGLLSSPAAMGVGGGTLLALLGGLWFMRRRKDSEEEGYEDFGSIEIDNKMDDMTFDDSALAESSDQDIQSFDSPFEETELESSDIIKNEVNSSDDITKGNEQEDILQEADVYIVYGLHDQAESELKRAIDEDPSNLAYRAKLLENYKAAGNKEAFEEEANAFMKLDIDGKDAYLDEIAAWGKALLPESKLFDSNTLKTAGAAGVAIVAGTALANEKHSTDTDNSEQLDLENTLTDEKLSELDKELEDLDLDNILSEETSDGSELLGLNDDLGINFDDLDDPENLEISTTNSDNLLTLGEEEPENEISDKDFEIEMESTEKLLESVENDEIDFLDLDNVESITGTDTHTKVDATDTTNLETANLNLDLDSDDLEKIMPKDNAYKKQASTDAEEDNLLADFDDNLSFLDLDDDSEVIEETQIETKLDLARAYIDMGDIEGARSTLEEVLQEGSDEQKREAEDLLHQTG